MESHMLTPWQQFGLIGLMNGAIVFLLFKIIVWTLATTKEILNQSAEERKAWNVQSSKEREIWNTTIERHSQTINDIATSIKRHDERAEERGSLVKKEHEKMIDNLNAMALQNKEITSCLGRINGYTHEEHKQ